MKAKTQVEFTIGMRKGQRGIVVTKRGFKCNKDQVVVEVNGEKIVVNKLNVKEK